MDDCTPEILLEILQKKYTGAMYKSSDSPFEIDSHQFLEFSILDSKNDDLHGRVNALSNIKRAIECRIDELVFILCLYKKKEVENWNFPKKITVLTELDIIAPRILGRINRQRNLLEHEYTNPSKENIEDALDVTILFLGYTDSFMQNIVEINFEDEYTCTIDRENDRFEVEIKGEKKVVNFDSSDEMLEIAKYLVPHLRR